MDYFKAGNCMSYKNVKGRVYDIQGYPCTMPRNPYDRFTKDARSLLWCHSPESQKFSFDLGHLPVKCSVLKYAERVYKRLSAEGHYR
jgi:hypothetical protein